MIRWIRRQLAQIRYHSATRHVTPWMRAMDIAFVASLLLAPAAAWISDQVTMREWTESDLYGRIGVDVDGGEFEAWIMSADRASDSWPASPTPYGEFWLVRVMAHRGAPLPSSIIHHRPRITLEPFSRAEPSIVNGELPPESGLRLAIEQALHDASYGSLVAAWREQQPPPQRRWLSLAVNAALWWIALSFVSWLAVSLARVASLIVSSRRLTRQLARESAGLCVHCGYDLRGLDFNERCPECGGLV